MSIEYFKTLLIILINILIKKQYNSRKNCGKKLANTIYFSVHFLAYFALNFDALNAQSYANTMLRYATLLSVTLAT